MGQHSRLEDEDGGAYRRAGVDIDAGARAVELMRASVQSTFGPQVLTDLGHFGGMYAIGDGSQVLVASADGVGTKVKITSLLGAHRSAGHDIVNHCVNDILTCGAKPLFFLDYIASEKIAPEQIAETVAGMAEACREAGCALLGGETAEMPGVYRVGEFDIAGFIVGMAQRDRLTLGEDITPGDVALALPSNGLHTNGYSLARKAFGLDDEDRPAALQRLNKYEPSLGCTLGEALIAPHTSYLNDIAPLLDLPERPIKGMAHITGGGLIENIPRALPKGCAVELDAKAWEVPPIFRLIQSTGRIEPYEMARVFNMGLGMVIFATEAHATLIQAKLPKAVRVGQVVEQRGNERVLIRGEGLGVRDWKLQSTSNPSPPTPHPSPLRLGVLASGRGTNLQAILDAIAQERLCAEVAVVICNHADAGAIERAKAAGVSVELHERKDYPSRLAQQTAIADRLSKAEVDLVVCAGWDRVFEPEFIERFAGRMINVHPSLLPAFGGGMHAIEDALRYGVKITGCTVHFVTNEVDSGPIISQAAVPTLPDDTVDTLAERVHREEHKLLVEAVKLFTRVVSS